MVKKSDVITHFLSSNVSPGRFADTLRDQDFITEDTWRKAHIPFITNSMKIRVLIEAVLSRINLDARNYDKFIAVLKQYGGLDDLITVIGSG